MTEITIGNATLYHGDSLEILPRIDRAVDSVVTDPPYGWRFMGQSWDGEDIENTINRKRRKGTLRTDGYARNEHAAFAAGAYDFSASGNQAFQLWSQSWAEEAFGILKPGAHMLVFCGPRTYHRMATGIEDAGFEIRDQLQWIFGSGFPKSHNLNGEWSGWGTALKPANEPIALARKPLSEKTIAGNVEKHSTGALNIEACRVDAGADYHEKEFTRNSRELRGGGYNSRDFHRVQIQQKFTPAAGRWPANVLLDEAAAEILDDQSGILKTGATKSSYMVKQSENNCMTGRNTCRPMRDRPADEGGASRFFYVAKASKSDRGEWNEHPTVKPTKLMAHLCLLITPPGGVILDPFMGSGTTGVAAVSSGFRFIGIEREKKYFEIARRRLEEAQRQMDLFSLGEAMP